MYPNNYSHKLETLNCAARDERHKIFFHSALLPLVLVFTIPSCLSRADGIISENASGNQHFQPKKRPSMPISVFIAEMPPPNRLVVAYSPSYSQSSGMLVGSNSVSPQNVAANTRWFYNPQKFIRLTPEYTNTFLQNAKIHYGVNEDFSIALTVSYVHNFLAFQTFKGPEGITPLGKSYSETMGLADLTSTAVVRLYEDPIHKITLNIRAGYPVGSNTVNKNSLQSNGEYKTTRATYAQQPSSQTFSLLPGLLYSGYTGPLSWGLAYRGRVFLIDNNQGWRPGNSNEYDSWLGYNITPEVEPTIRATYTTWQPVTGFDVEINGKTPGADPQHYGGKRVDVHGGVIVNGKLLGLDNYVFASEVGAPVLQILNGPQQKTNWQGALQIRYSY